YLIEPITDLSAKTTDELSNFIRNTSGTRFNGTAAMLARAASWLTMNSRDSQIDFGGLSIIDASPFIPGAWHTQVGTYVIAERGADLVK
ncbi:hypothetical protein FB45DRAFT_713462, partial [Roridomyces roridus]